MVIRSNNEIYEIIEELVKKSKDTRLLAWISSKITG